MVARLRELVILGLIWGMSHSSAWAQSNKAKRLDLDEPASKTVYQPLEEYPTGRWAEFQKQAEQLWTTEPDHPYAARGMFDWLLVAKFRQVPQPDIDRVQMELLSRHASSVYAMHLMRISNPQELRPRLSAWFEQQTELSESFLTQFGRVALLGFSVHGPTWLTVDDYGIESLLAARVAKLQGLAGLLEAKFADAPEATRKILEAGLNTEQSPAVRYVRLSEFGETKSARVIQKALWMQLSDDDRQSPRVQAALAEQLLRDGNLDLVAPIAERLLKVEPNNPRWLLWSGCCLIATNRDAEGRKHLQQLAETKAGSDESAVAKQLLPLLDTLSQSESACAHLLEVAGQQIVQSAPQMLSFESTFVLKEGEPGRLQIQFNGPRFSVVCLKGDRPRAGFQSDRALCRFFTKDDAVIYELAGSQTQPAITFQLKDIGNGIGWNINTNLVADPVRLMPVLQKFLESPALVNGGWNNLLKRRRAYGTFATPVADSKGQKHLRWLNVDLLKSKVFEYGCHISESGDLQQIQLGETRVDRIQYGQLDDFKLSKLDWPEYPVQRVPPSDFAGMMRLMTVITQINSLDDSADFPPPASPIPMPQKR